MEFTPASRRPPPYRSRWAAAGACALGGVILFQFFGNAARGYIASSSLFYWWGFQWVNPGSETEHGWLILGLSAWLWWRNVRVSRRWETEDRGQGTGDRRQETRDRRQETRDRRQGTGDRRQETGGGRRVAGHRRQAEEAILPAVLAMAGGLALHAVGFAAQQTRISIIALLIFTWGVVRLGGGRRWGDAAMFPLGFMLFALPISVLDEVGLPLRLWVTTAGEEIAHFAGIEVIRSGTQLVAPDGRFNYDVAAPCSGVRSLMALTALSVLVAYLNFTSTWRRLLVVALSLPLVYLGNVARIVAIIFAAQAGGSAWGDRAHQVMGYGVFVIVLGGVLLGVAVIHRWWPDGQETRDRGQETGERGHGTGDWGRQAGDEALGAADRGRRWGGRGAVGAAAGVGLLVVIEMFFLHWLAEMPPRGQVGVALAADGLNPVELPAFLGTDWIGRRAEVTAVEREMLPPDTGFSRKNYAFVADRSRDVFLSIVLSGRDRTSIHRPELCLVGQGWTIDGAARHTFQSSGEGAVMDREFRATVLRVRREIATPRGKVVVPQLVAYWFVGGDTVVPSNWQRFVRDAWNRVVRARADRWAYVLMQTDARDGEAAAIARMQTILDGTLSAFQRTFPGSTQNR